jgi:hypothetical protein
MEFDITQYLSAAAAFGAMLTTTFLRGFQNKNVAGGHKKLAFVFGGAMTAFEGIVIGLIATSGWHMIPFAAVGSAFGWVLGMVSHDRVMRNYNRKRKQVKKSKRARRMDRSIDRRLEELGILKEDN